LNSVAAYIGVGANIGSPEEQVRNALDELANLPATRLERVSSLYRTAPVGFVDQPDFVNAVAKVETALDARELLDALLGIERRHGRVREFPNGPRTLDLDVLLYGDMELNEPGLIVPHPRMHERAFVMVPLAEIAPELLVPGRGSVRDLVQKVDTNAVRKLEATTS
jgi:2-amino-4-hydroxy-6-hydroxymethyldihydropteridine diphosphokinase